MSQWLETCFFLFCFFHPPVDDSLCCLPSCQHCVSVLCVLRLRSRRSALFRIQSLSPRRCFFLLFFFVSSFVVIVSVTSVRPCNSTPTPQRRGCRLGSRLSARSHTSACRKRTFCQKKHSFDSGWTCIRHPPRPPSPPAA